MHIAGEDGSVIVIRFNNGSRWECRDGPETMVVALGAQDEARLVKYLGAVAREGDFAAVVGEQTDGKK